jgi:putative ABC transport system permease protein
MALLRRISNLFRRSSIDREIEAELRAHLEMRIEDNIASGMSPDSARRDALLRFGNPTVTKERVAASDAVLTLQRIGMDVRYALRRLVKSPGFSATATLTLALGIGANTAMFSVIRSVLIRSWPFPHSDRLVLVSQRQANGNSNLFSTKDFLDWKQQGGLLAGMGAHFSWQFNISSPEGPPQRIPGGVISHDFLRVLGTQPMLGRLFSLSEDRSGAGQFVMLSYVLWKNHFSADPNIVGKAIQIEGMPYTVIGVMPVGFNGFDGKELLWTLLQLRPDSGTGSSPNFHWLTGVIRLPDGTSLKQARSELDAAAIRLHRENPSSDVGFGVSLQTLNDAFTSSVRPALLMLMGCVGFVLLIACVNVANLLLARGAARQREMAVRTALGASRSRIVRQLLTESMLLAGAGGAAGIAVALLLLRGMLSLHPPQVPHIEQTSVDSAVLAYAVLVSMIVGILFGLAPAIEASRTDVNESLREQLTSTPRRFGRQHSILIIAETALACMLLIATGLALKSLWSLRDVNFGFVPANILTFRIAAPSQLDAKGLPDFYRQMVEHIRSIPGVESVSAARDLPLSGIDPSTPILTEGKSPAPVQGEIVTRYRAVGDDYFRVLQIPLRRGRAFDRHDTASSPTVAIVSESLAREYWPGESAVGKRLKPNIAGSSWCVVVGVVADVRHWGADVVVEPTAYYPYSQVPESMRSLLEANMAIAVRSRMPQNDLLHSISSAVADVNTQVPLYEVKTMESMVSDSDSLRNFDLLLLGWFSFLALALAVVGVYGVMAYSVSQRTREIGIRIALGARPRDVLRLILRQGARLAIAGSVIGVVGAFLLRKIMASFLYGLSANDPFILCVVPCVMVLVIVLACWLPARRATKIDPTMALRYE